MAKRRIGFPRMDNYNIALKYMVEMGCGCEYVMAPPMTRKTLELGSKYCCKAKAVWTPLWKPAAYAV